MSPSPHNVGIIGAGTMGAGIAQVAAAAGWDVRLLDVDQAIAGKAIAGVTAQLGRLVEKGRMTSTQRDDAAARLHAAGSPAAFADCGLVIEAVVERLDVKVQVLGAARDAAPSDTILATNTSSLSVGALGDALGAAGRTVGMHFFNPAPVMKLVEVVAGPATTPDVVDRTAAIAGQWGKVTARAADVPGFIVNHVARPYYLEAFRILEDGLATAAQVDAAMRTVGGFRMGPLELTDLIGQDVNTATTRSVWERLGRPPLLAPSRLQEQLVAAGHLGRKTGLGVYRYPPNASSGDTPVAAIEVEPRPLELNPALASAVEAFASAGAAAPGDDPHAHYIFVRILAGLIVQASHARDRGVAAAADIDTALRFGTNYPRGPFEWARVIGAGTVERLLAALDDSIGGGRFAGAVSLRA